jgi:hypothetical protein
LSVEPVVESDASRQLFASLDLLTMTKEDALAMVAAHLKSVGLAENWAPVANLSIGNLGLKN